jgi:uncharacterized protein YpiB (UPF0302 family)
MANKEHDFLITLRMDGKTIASRNVKVVEYNDNVIYSLRLNKLMQDMSALVEDALKDNSVEEGHRLLQRGLF